MLTHLHLRNFAIVERLELGFRAGLSVLTGETGAGKSILVDALGLALGGRAHQSVVRPGASRAEIDACFAPERGSGAEAWLRENALDDESGECLVRRVVNRDGRSRAYVNGRPIPVQALRSLGERLVDIHGQHAHQSLLRRETQRDIVDSQAEDRKGIEELEARYRDLARLRAALEDAAPLDGREDRHAFLTWQIRDLEALDASADEFDELLSEHRMLSHRGELLAAGSRALDALDGEDAPSAAALAVAASNELSRMARHLPECEGLRELIDGALIQMQEAAGTLRRTHERIEADPGRLARLDARLSELHASARRHRVEARELPALLERARGELDASSRAEARRSELGAQVEAARQEYRRAAQRVHRSRSAAAETLSGQITASLRQLGMRDARFRIEVLPEPERPPGPRGDDRVEFLVSANRGQPLRPVAQVASGGELSRLSLAVQALASGSAGVSTLVFDEVDAGIGARVADIVGMRLRALAAARQVLCVTHLPQIASQAHHHIRVEKQVAGADTKTVARPISDEQRVRELAYMLAGTEPTSRSLAHAREMLRRSSSPAEL